MPFGGIAHLVDDGAVGLSEQDDRGALVIQRRQSEAADGVGGGCAEVFEYAVGIRGQGEVVARSEGHGEGRKRVTCAEVPVAFTQGDGEASHRQRAVGAIVELDVFAAARLRVEEDFVNDHLPRRHLLRRVRLTRFTRHVGRIRFIGLLRFVYCAVRVLLTRCAAACVGAEVPLIALATLYRYAGLRLRVSVRVDHRA